MKHRLNGDKYNAQIEYWKYDSQILPGLVANVLPQRGYIGPTSIAGLAWAQRAEHLPETTAARHNGEMYAAQGCVTGVVRVG